MSMATRNCSYRGFNYYVNEAAGFELVKLLCFKNLATKENREFAGSPNISRTVARDLLFRGFIRETGRDFTGEQMYRLTKPGTHIACVQSGDILTMNRIQPQYRDLAIHPLAMENRRLKNELAELRAGTIKTHRQVQVC